MQLPHPVSGSIRFILVISLSKYGATFAGRARDLDEPNKSGAKSTAVRIRGIRRNDETVG